MKLSEQSKKDLQWSMRKALLTEFKDNVVITESDKQIMTSFVKEESTFEQLLNLVYNPIREETYLKSESLENMAICRVAHFLKLESSETFKCPKCGSKVLAQTKYCVKCKEKVEPTSECNEGVVPGVRDGTGPLGSGQEGQRKAAGEECVTGEASEEPEPEEVAKDIKGGEDTVKTGLDKVEDDKKDDVLAALRKMKENIDLTSVNGKMKLLEWILDTQKKHLTPKKSVIVEHKAEVKKSSLDENISHVKKILQKHPGLKSSGSHTLIESVSTYWTYKRFLNKEGKLCANNSNRVSCINQCKLKAIQSTINTLNEAKIRGSKKLVGSYDRQIVNWKEKLARTVA